MNVQAWKMVLLNTMTLYDFPWTVVTLQTDTFGLHSGLQQTLHSTICSYAWSRGHAASSVTPVLPPPGRFCRTVCLNSFGNRTSPSDNSNDRWERLCSVSRAAALCVWTLRALTRNLIYLLTYEVCYSFEDILAILRCTTGATVVSALGDGTARPIVVNCTLHFKIKTEQLFLTV